MDEWIWSNGGMILTGENWSTGRKTLYSVGGRWMNEYGAMVEWYWEGKTEVLREKPVPVQLFPPQILHGQDWHWNWVSMTIDRLLTSEPPLGLALFYISKLMSFHFPIFDVFHNAVLSLAIRIYLALSLSLPLPPHSLSLSELRLTRQLA
jgi:hypothetical protein